VAKAKKMAKSKNSAAKMITVTLAKGVARTREDHRATVRGLGLKWTNHTVDVVDTECTRGMINKVGYLLKVVERPRGTTGQHDAS